MPGSDVAVGVRMHLLESGVPEEPDVLLVRNGFGILEILVDCGVGTKIKNIG